jgi:LacI family transcriptional regulator, fructose operon transcriptional repressor
MVKRTRPMTTIRDLATHCGVSTSTVSRALAGKAYIRDEVREKIQAAAKELGYRPNLVARNLRSSRSTTLGLVVADVQNPFFTRICRAVEDRALREGYAVFLCNSDEDPRKEELYLRHLIDENVAGIILAPTARTARAQAALKDLPLPLVAIDRPVKPGIADSVAIDNQQAGYDLARHLITRGRRALVGLFGAKSLTGAPREHGFWQAIDESGIDRNLCRAIEIAPREEDGYRQARALLAAPEPIDALIASNGLMASGVFRALVESSRPCPEEIAFACFDEAAWSHLVSPSVTVIEQPTYEIGVTATELLLQRIEQPERSYRRIVLAHRLVERASTAAPAVQRS